MHSTLHLTSTEERQELDGVLQELGPSSRLGRLLHYLGERYFSSDGDLLSEYTIATQVFGRSKSTFDASEDAIVRVELHRLRKRLKEFYEAGGRDHAIQISIPHGTYVPLFTRKLLDEPRDSAVVPCNDATVAAALDAPRQPSGAAGQTRGLVGSPRRIWMLILAVLAFGTTAVVALYIFRTHASSPTVGRGAPPLPQTPPAPASVTATVVRILCGYSGPPQTDSSGAVWGPDRFVQGGGGWRRANDPIIGTSDPLLFGNWRSGDSSYDIPLAKGTYELHLYFVAPVSSGGDMPTFSVRVNGKVALSGFDIETDALGANVADERIFRDISPAPDGELHLAFMNERGAPRVNAIEIVPGLPHKTLPIRLVMQHTSHTDDQGRFWHADNYYFEGMLSEHLHEVSGSTDPTLFSSERYGHFTYAIPVDTQDRYTVVLHFAESYFGPDMPGGGGVGSRVFKVMCNGRTLLGNFDIYKQAGSRHELTETFYHLQPSSQGKLNVTFEPIVNNATISGIEVLDESQ